MPKRVLTAGELPKKLTLRSLDEKVEARFTKVYRLLVSALVAAFLVGAGMLGGVWLFVNNASNEGARTCHAMDKVVEYLFEKAPRTRSLPQRTPEQQADYEKAQRETRAGVAAACGG